MYTVHVIREALFRLSYILYTSNVTREALARLSNIVNTFSFGQGSSKWLDCVIALAGLSFHWSSI